MRANSALMMIGARMLLRSWAIPPLSVPMASSFWVWRRLSSASAFSRPAASFFCAVTSSNARRISWAGLGALKDSTAVHAQGFATDDGKVRFDLQIMKLGVPGKHIVQQFLEFRDLPLTAAEIVKESAFRRLGRSLEGLIIRLVRRFDPHSIVENKQGFPNGFDDRFRVVQRLVQGDVPVLQLVRQRRELFIRGLKLFSGGLQFLIHALELFISRHRLFVRRPQLLGDRLMLIDDGPELFVCRPQFSFLELVAGALSLFPLCRSGFCLARPALGSPRAAMGPPPRKGP